MKRYAANLVYCSPNNLLKNGVVEIDEKTGIVEHIFSLNDIGDEIQSTIFFNGIILPFELHISFREKQQSLTSLLNEQFAKNPLCEISPNKKCNLWLLEGDSLFSSQIPNESWKISPINFSKK